MAVAVAALPASQLYGALRMCALGSDWLMSCVSEWLGLITCWMDVFHDPPCLPAPLSVHVCVPGGQPAPQSAVLCRPAAVTPSVGHTQRVHSSVVRKTEGRTPRTHTHTHTHVTKQTTDVTHSPHPGSHTDGQKNDRGRKDGRTQITLTSPGHTHTKHREGGAGRPTVGRCTSERDRGGGGEETVGSVGRFWRVCV